MISLHPMIDDDDDDDDDEKGHCSRGFRLGCMIDICYYEVGKESFSDLKELKPRNDKMENYELQK